MTAIDTCFVEMGQGESFDLLLYDLHRRGYGENRFFYHVVDRSRGYRKSTGSMEYVVDAVYGYGPYGV